MIMLLVTHIAIALGSIIIAAHGLVRPSVASLRRSYIGIGATLSTGTALVVASNSNILHSCLTGLAYLVGMVIATAAIHYKLAAERIK